MRKVKLKDVLKIHNGTTYKHLNTGDVPLYGSGGVMSFVNDYLYEGEAVLLPRKGSLSNIMYTEGKIWTVDTMYYATTNNEANPYYLYSFLSQLDLAHLDSGSALPSMTKSAYENIEIVLPHKLTQDQVANVLKSIDAKIALNTRINAELEKMAKTLYDYWFVQFDFPNEEGKPYKSSGGKMVFSPELGREIPWGWEVLKLGDIGKVSMCKRIHKHETSLKEEIPFYKISTFGKVADVFISRETFDEYKTKYSYPNKGDILISAAGTIGKTVIFDGEDSFFQDSNIVWVDNDETVVPNAFLYVLYQTKPWVTTNGSTIKRLYNDDIRNISFAYPCSKLVNQNCSNISEIYSKSVVPFLEKIIQIKKQNHRLTQLRDWLLPMLMNGQVRVE